LCEGEKDADRLASLGLVATTVAGQNWSEAAAEALRGRTVYILEDNDKAGRENSAASATAMMEMAKEIHIVRLPDLNHKEDVSDWLNAGHTKEELIDVCRTTPIWGVALFNIWDLDGVDVPVQIWSVPDRIPIGSTTLFSGEGAAGKSLIELQAGVAHALDVNWLGNSVRPGRALFIDAEDATDVIHRRLHDILTHHGRRFADLRDKLYVESLFAKDAVLAVGNRKSGKVETTILYAQILEMVGDLKPVRITIASSANVFAGNELDRVQVQQFVAHLSYLAAIASGSVVLVSHPSLAGIATDSGLSGSTQWHNAVRARVYIKGIKEEEGEPQGNLRVIEFRKNQYGPISEEIVVKYHNGLFVPANTTVDVAAREAQADSVYLAVLKILTDQNQDLSPAPKANYSAATLISQHPSARPFGKKDMEAAQQRLLDANQIHIRETGPESKRRKRVVPGPRPAGTTDPM
jgi:RecA-family ATPase